MFRKAVTIAAILLVGSAASAMAQSRAQLTVFGGWTLSDGVSGDPVRASDGNTYDTVDLKDAFNWGLGFGFYTSDNVEIGFLFSQQMSTVSVEGTATRELGDMKINNYHPYVAFNLGDADAAARPYILLGLGATTYGGVDYTKANGERVSADSETQFSGTLGAGVKLFPSPKVGLHLGMQWTPTYIKSDATGWWCDPYWGCYVVGDAQYSNQFQFNGGIIFRF